MTPRHHPSRHNAESPGLILMYHRIVRHEPAGRFAVTLGHFEEHLRVLVHRGYTILPLAALATSAARRDLPARAVAITFDDGYTDYLEETIQVLTRYAAPTTFFVVGAALTPGYEFWWDRVEAIFSGQQHLPSTMALHGRSGLVTVGTATDEQRRLAKASVTHLCYEASLEERDSLMSQLGDWSGYAPTFSRSRPMTIAELRHLVTAAGVEIGAHTENHLWLPKHAAETQWTELSVAKTRLEGVLGCRVNSLAYPYGAFDSTTVSLAQQAGFVVGVSAEAGPVTSDAHPLALPRYEVGDDDADAFGAFLTRLHD